MLSPRWVSAAASAGVGNRERFCAAVARRLDLPGYEALTAEDPLVTWVEVESLFRAHRAPPRPPHVAGFPQRVIFAERPSPTPRSTNVNPRRSGAVPGVRLDES